MANKDQIQSLDLTPLLTPISILLSGLMVSISLFFGLRGLSIDVKDKVDDVAYSSSSSSSSSSNSSVSGASTTPAAVTASTLKEVFQGDYIKFGGDDRKVMVVEISDPSCPYCHAASGLNPTVNAGLGSQFVMVADGGTYVAPVPEIKKLVDEGKVSYAWIYSNGHGNGEMGTKAFYCAYEQGKFWEVHDKLMTAEGYQILNEVIKNDKSKSGELTDFLGSAVDKNALKSCLDSGKYDSRIASDQQLGTSYQIQGTPSFYINDEYFPGAYSFNEMKTVIDQAL